MGTFFPNCNDTEDDDDAMMICNDTSSSDNNTPRTYNNYTRSNSLSNDYCPHSSQLFPLMEADVDLPLVPSSLRKQTAVTCLAALAETPDYEGPNAATTVGSHALLGGVFGTALVAQDADDDEWGHFAQHHETQVSRSAASRRVRIPSPRRKPHQRRRSSAKFERHGERSSTNVVAWRG